ncbi:hypothetical protein ELI41_29535 (plasmid) [Rhizobium leguminosarum]|uniref:hypothetical protein n=1 Tax=Rhizobium leguminosarum TaxID=384 RepID=UPI001031135C|nr:hypothetical protein [Rhizobium leguminosarum]TAU80451.1 hypothetical protein ELI41_29535 [Rhizobium leguminosarum]
MSAADWIAIYAAIVATGALSLEVRRWFESGPKVYMRAQADMAIIGSGIEKNGLLLVTATNRGDAPTTITNLCLLEFPNMWSLFRNRAVRSFVVPHPQLEGRPPIVPHVLKVGEQWMGMAHERSDVTGDIQTGRMWAAIYTTDRDRPYLAHIKKKAPNKLEGAKAI